MTLLFSLLSVLFIKRAWPQFIAYARRPATPSFSHTVVYHIYVVFKHCRRSKRLVAFSPTAANVRHYQLHTFFRQFAKIDDFLEVIHISQICWQRRNFLPYFRWHNWATSCLAFFFFFAKNPLARITETLNWKVQKYNVRICIMRNILVKNAKIDQFGHFLLFHLFRKQN